MIFARVKDATRKTSARSTSMPDQTYKPGSVAGRRSMPAIIDLLRVTHWIKNLLVLFPVVLAQRVSDAGAWLSALAATGVFCLASSAVYVFNDIRDRASDRLHPDKKNRPLASGRLGAGTALVLAVVLAAASLVGAAAVNVALLVVVAAFLVLQVAYSTYLKQKMLLDVMCIALGFVLRAAGGAVAIGVPISPWLFVCTLTVCLFMGFCKRCNEIASIRDAALAESHRKTLVGYSSELLTHLITLSAGIAIISFMLYATSRRTMGNFGAFRAYCIIYTLPLVIYGVCRFAMLSMQAGYPGPTELILRDRPFQLILLLWMLAMVAIVLWGGNLEEWLRIRGYLT